MFALVEKPIGYYMGIQRLYSAGHMSVRRRKLGPFGTLNVNYSAGFSDLGN